MTLAVERDLFSEYRYATGERRSELEDELVREHYGLSLFVASKYYASPLKEDAHSLALIGLLMAIRNYEPEKGFAFSSFATRLMYNEINMQLRKLKNLKNLSLQTAISLDRELDSEDEGDTFITRLADDSPAVDEQVERMEETRSILEVLYSPDVLTERQRQVLILLYRDDLSQAETAKIVGVSQAHVSRIKVEAKRRIRQSLNLKGDVNFSKKHDDGLVDLAKRNGVSENLFYKRVTTLGWTPMQAATKPVARKRYSEEDYRSIETALLEKKSRKDIQAMFPSRTVASVNSAITSTQNRLKSEGLL